MRSQVVVTVGNDCPRRHGPSYHPAIMGSDILFARPSFLSGVARAIDLFGVFDDYNVSATPEEADARATYADWSTVGQDLLEAMDGVAGEVAAADPQLSLFE